MKLKTLTWLAAGALVLCCTACAPVDHSVAKDDDSPEPDDRPTEVLPVSPVPLPPGPRYRIESAVQNVRDRDLRTDNGFWTVFHGILGLGPSVMLLDPKTGTKVNAVDYICNGGELPGLQFLPTRWGLDVTTTGLMGRGQGHQDQFIAEMAQWGMSKDRKFRVLGKDYTYMDFVRNTQMRASLKRNQELSWTILIVGQYLGTDISWTNGYGDKLRFEDLLRYELDAPMETAACGGTHRLFDLCWVYYLHLRKGGKTEGVWKDIVDATAKYRDLAKKYQNADGTFSTSFFNGPGDDADKQRRINTTGHTLEWLALALPEAELREEWVQNAANALALLILDLQGAPIEGGSLYHAVHGLLLYYARVYDRETLGPKELYYPLPPAEAVSKRR
jgi:hypothetical protein